MVLCVKMAAFTKTMALLTLVSCIILKVKFATTSAFDCPQMCDCYTPTMEAEWYKYVYKSNNTLTVDCKGRDVNESTLAQELDLLLSDNELTENLLWLTISSTPLTHVPMSICQLSNLQWLVLDDDQLIRLPDNCFTNMTALRGLVARRNNITELQDGLFDGLNSLEVLVLSYNMIASIGLHVFSNPNDLVNLKYILLDYNRLRSLEPWPYIRGLHGSQDSRISVVLQNNLITEFTNNIGWQFNCKIYRGVEYKNYPSYAFVDIEFNNIRHVNDIAFGWHMTYDQWRCIKYDDFPNPTPDSMQRGFPLQPARQVFAFTLDYRHSFTYHCDCLDFALYYYSQPKYNAYFMGSTNYIPYMVCSQPSFLANRWVFDVPLNEFVCESSEFPQLSQRCPPGCRCVRRPANYTVHIYCSAANLTSLPLNLPPLSSSHYKYKLDLSNNKLLRRLEHRPYFVNTYVLDVSNCAISVVDLNAWRDFAMMSSKPHPFPGIEKGKNYSVVVIPVVFLHGNKMESLPFNVTEINLTTVRLTLNDNPWKCSCDNRWMIAWFKSLSLAASSNVNDVLCGSPSRLKGRSILQSDKVDFCVDPLMRMLKIVLSSTLSVVAGLLLLGFTLYCLRVRLFIRWKFHPFDRDECVGEDMDYDVFLCCSSEDDNPHGLRILQLMESKGYRVCYHERDFLPGERVTDNMIQSIIRSKRTVCLVSRNFLRSNYCMFEFDAAYHHNVAVKRKKRLIVLMALDSLDDLDANDVSDTTMLRQFIRQYTYIDYRREDCLDKLLYALPLRGLLQHNDDQMMADIGDDVPLIQDI